MVVIRAGIHKMLVRIANREDPDQMDGKKSLLTEVYIMVHVLKRSLHGVVDKPLIFPRGHRFGPSLHGVVDKPLTL